jgi:DNA-binding NtrC family response regulator
VSPCSPLLVVDDDPDFVLLLEALLAPRGYPLIAVASLEEALEVGPRVAPGAAFLDSQLGTESGLDLIVPLQARFPHTPIIFSTAFGSRELALRAMRLGASGFLPKPLDEVRLLDSLSRAYAEHDLLARAARTKSRLNRLPLRVGAPGPARRRSLRLHPGTCPLARRRARRGSLGA